MVLAPAAAAVQVVAEPAVSICMPGRSLGARIAMHRLCSG